MARPWSEDCKIELKEERYYVVEPQCLESSRSLARIVDLLNADRALNENGVMFVDSCYVVLLKSKASEEGGDSQTLSAWLLYRDFPGNRERCLEMQDRAKAALRWEEGAEGFEATAPEEPSFESCFGVWADEGPCSRRRDSRGSRAGRPSLEGEPALSDITDSDYASLNSSTSEEQPHPLLMPMSLDYPLSRSELHLRTHWLADQLRASVEKENQQLKRKSLGGRSPKGNEVLQAQVQALRMELNNARSREQAMTEETQKALAEARSWEQQVKELQSKLGKLVNAPAPAEAELEPATPTLAHAPRRITRELEAMSVPEQQQRELEEEFKRLLQGDNSPVTIATETTAESHFGALYGHVMRGLLCLRFRDYER